MNRYEMSLGVWIGVDNHGNFIFFGCVLLQNEKISSFSWTLKVNVVLSFIYFKRFSNFIANITHYAEFFVAHV